MKPIIVSILTLIFFYDSGAQSRLKVKDNVRLVKWSSQDCDNTFDPYRLKTRISNIQDTDSTTIFTIHFSENCCIPFKPEIKFYNNKLVLLPYGKYTGDYCSCNCCFSITYEVSGLADKKYQLYFKDKEVFLSEDYYNLVKPTYQVYNGKKINGSNKYGFKEGTWIEFYENGAQKVVNKYPDQSLFFDLDPIWSKGYYQSGNLSFYDRKDTSESWFEDGEIRSQTIKYKAGDTAYEKCLRKFENRLLQIEYVERYYPTVFKSEFDPDYEGEGGIFETLYKQEYFRSGKPKFLYGADTSFSWFETGQIEFKQFKGGKIEFDKGGWIRERLFAWAEKGSKTMGDLDNSLYVTYFPNGNIKEMHFARDELTDGGIAPGIHYYWKWDTNLNLIKSPQRWKEVFPWERFSEIQLLPAMYKGLKKNR